MKQTKRLFAIAAGILVLAACRKEGRDHGENNDRGPGHVYTITNDAKINSLVDYRRSENGHLTWDSSYATGGTGTGAGLGSQGAVILVGNSFVLAVNAGSNSISSFKITNHGLVLKSTVQSGGTMPLSIAEHRGIVFVVNGGGDGNISGFSLGNDGKLSAIANSTKPLSGSNPGPAQISFVGDGNAVAITEKNSNEIITYTLSGTLHKLTSANATPFGFTVGRNGNIFVTEAAGGTLNASTVSTYYIDNSGAISLVKGPIATYQTSACWLAMTDNGRYAFSSNTASNTMSSFNTNTFTGDISLIDSIAASAEGKPAESALAGGSRFLYVLTPGANTISAFTVAQDGRLHNLQSVTGVSTSGAGLAAE